MKCVVKNRKEEVMKLLAVGLCLAMVGLTVIPLTVGEFKYGWVASSFGTAWSIGHRDVVGAIASGISAAAALAGLAFLPASAPLWLIALCY